MKHLLSIEQLSRDEIVRILRATVDYKKNREKNSKKPLVGQTWALIFSKPSTRPRVSFEVGIRELGGNSIYLNATDAPRGRGERSKDTARGRGLRGQGAGRRTYAQAESEEVAEGAGRPTRNA